VVLAVAVASDSLSTSGSGSSCRVPGGELHGRNHPPRTTRRSRAATCASHSRSALIVAGVVLLLRNVAPWFKRPGGVALRSRDSVSQ